MPVLHLDLSVKNPHGVGAIAHRRPEEILEEIAALDAESAEVLESRSFPVRTCYINNLSCFRVSQRFGGEVRLWGGGLAVEGIFQRHLPFVERETDGTIGRSGHQPRSPTKQETRRASQNLEIMRNKVG
jgi:hypothetical protein